MLTRTFLLWGCLVCCGFAFELLQNGNANCTIYVSSSRGSDSPACGSLTAPCGTIQRAVWNVPARGSIICVWAEPGRSYGCPADQGVVVNVSTTIQSINGTSVIDCAQSGRAFTYLSVGHASLTGFTIKNGKSATDGGAIYFGQIHQVVVEGCTFADNQAAATSNAQRIGNGGAIFVTLTSASASIVLRNNTFLRNSALGIWSNGGGAVYFLADGASLSTVVLERNNFIANAAPGSGGDGYGWGAAILMSSATASNSTWVFRNNSFVSNFADLAGTVVFVPSSLPVALPFIGNAFEFSDNLFADNACSSCGYGPPLCGAVSVGLFTSNTVKDNLFDFRGNTFRSNQLPALWILAVGDNLLNVTGDAFTGNSGGAMVLNIPRIRIRGASFSSNSAALGGAIQSGQAADFRIYDSVFISNVASGAFGGGAIVAGGQDGLVVQNCTFVSNVSPSGFGGAISVTGVLQVTNSTFTENSAALGGAIWVGEGSDVSVSLSHFKGNSASIAGGIGANDTINGTSSISIVGSSFEGNSAVAGAALMVHYAAIFISGSVFESNKAQQTGAVHVNGTRTCAMRGSVFLNNTGGYGGSVYIAPQTPALVIADSQFSLNSATEKGGAIFTKSQVQLLNCSFHLNIAWSYSGGAVSSAGVPLTVQSCSFTQNVAQLHGGAIFGEGVLYLNVAGSSFFGNWVTAPQEGTGGAIYVDSGPVTLDDCEFRESYAYSGGAIWLGAVVPFFARNSRFISNKGHGNGGAMAIESGSATMEGSGFIANTADSGGAIYLGASPFLSLNRCSFVSNQATSAGGAVCATNTTLTVDECTFAENAVLSGSGGALFVTCAHPLEILGSSFSANGANSSSTGSTGGGGALFARCDAAIIKGNNFSANFAQGSGGALWMEGLSVSVEVSKNLFEANLCYEGMGGAIYAEYLTAASHSSLSFNGNILSGNQGFWGGALCIYSNQKLLTSATVILCNNTFARNAAEAAGGGIAVRMVGNSLLKDNRLVLRSNNFTNNIVSGEYGMGGAMTWNYFTPQTTGGSVIGNLLSLSDNTYVANTADTGGAVSLIYGSASSGSLVAASNNTHQFLHEVWTQNSAVQGNGGAVSVIFPPDRPSVHPSHDSTGMRTWFYTNNTNTFRDNTFSHNSALCSNCVGGAINLNSGKARVDRCTFAGNEASFGSAVGVSGLSTKTSIHSSRFNRNPGGDIYSFAGGAFTVAEDTFIVPTGGDRNGIIFVPQGGLFNLSGGSVIYCDDGEANLTESSFVEDRPPWGSVNMSSTLLSCSVCPRGMYILNVNNATVSTDLLESRCHSCLGTCICEGGARVRTLPGYWCGADRDDATRMICKECPHGYCHYDEIRPWNSTCKGERTGTLCGRCSDGYSEGYGSFGCVANDDCGSNAIWFLLAGLAVSLAYVLLVLRFPISHHPLWKSTLYFMQIIPLITSIENDVMRGILAVFSLDLSILGVGIDTCPWEGLTAVDKMASGYLLPIVLLGTLLLVFTIHRVFRWIRDRGPMRSFQAEEIRPFVGEEEKELGTDSSEDDDDVSDDDRSDLQCPVPGAVGYTRYSAALTGLMLLMYEGVTSVTMDLLHCVDVGGSLRLFKAGEQVCYTVWQYPLFVLLGCFLVPFPLLLLLVRYIIRRRFSRNAHGYVVLQVLEGPYKPNRRWWESVGMMRRLVLVALATFVVDPLARAVSLFAGCFIVLVTHSAWRPHKDKKQEAIDAIFLSGLVVVSALEIPAGVYSYLGVAFDGSGAEALEYTQAVLTLLPLAFCGLLVCYTCGIGMGRRLHPQAKGCSWLQVPAWLHSWQEGQSRSINDESILLEY